MRAAPMFPTTKNRSSGAAHVDKRIFPKSNRGLRSRQSFIAPQIAGFVLCGPRRCRGRSENCALATGSRISLSITIHLRLRSVSFQASFAAHCRTRPVSHIFGIPQFQNQPVLLNAVLASKLFGNETNRLPTGRKAHWLRCESPRRTKSCKAFAGANR